jgi:hypothetical protein
LNVFADCFPRVALELLSRFLQHVDDRYGTTIDENNKIQENNTME